MFIRQVMSAICRIGLLSAVSLTVLPTMAAKAEPVILVFDLKIDTHNGGPLSQPTIMSNLLVRFDNNVTGSRTSIPAVTKWTYFKEMQDAPSVPETPYTDGLLALNPGWPYQMGNDAIGRQYYRISGDTHPNSQGLTIGTSAMANYTDPQGTIWYWLYYRSVDVQEPGVFSGEGEVGFFTSESLMALLQRALVNGYPFSFEEYSGFSNDLPDGAGSMSEFYDGIATLKFIAAKEVPLDIKPGACPNSIVLAARGRIKAAILGTSEFDVASVNLQTIRLEGVPPLRYSYSDVGTPFYPESGYSDFYQCSTSGGDGYQDLFLQFDAKAIAENLNSPVKKTSRVMVLTGETLDGTRFVARDVVKIVH